MAKAATKPRPPRTRTKRIASAEPLNRVLIQPVTRLLHSAEEMRRPTLQQLVKRWGRWVHRCISINSQTAASVPLRLFSVGNKGVVEKSHWLKPQPVDKRTKAWLTGRMRLKVGAQAQKRLQGNIEDLTEIMNHPALMLLDNVNEWEEGYGFRESWYADLQSCGRLFTAIISDTGNVPTALWRMMPHWTEVIPAPSDKHVEKFVYGHKPNTVDFKPEDVFWLKLHDPWNPWGGLSPLEAWLKSIDADNVMVAFQEWIFNRGGTPDVLVIVKGGMSPDQQKTFRKDWRRMFGSYANREESLAFAEGEVDVKPLSTNPKDLDFIKGREIIRDEICQAFGVPKSLITSDDVNRANAREGRNSYLETTIWPMIVRVEDALNQRLLPRWSDRLVLIHDNPIKEDETIRVQDRESKLRSGWTVNEIRQEDGEEALEDPRADVPMIVNNVLPLGMAGAPTAGVSSQATAAPVANAAATNADGTPADSEEADKAKLPPVDLKLGLELLTAYYDQTIPREAALQLAQASLGMTAEQADQFIPEEAPDAPKSESQIAQEEAEREALVARAQPKPAPQKSLATTDESAVEIRSDLARQGHEHSSFTATECIQKAWLTKLDRHVDRPQAGLPESGKVNGFKRDMAAILLAQAEEIVRQAGIASSPIEVRNIALAIVRQPQWIISIADASKPFIEEGVEIGARAGIKKLPATIEAGFDVFNPEVQRFIERASVKLATGVNKTTEFALEDVLGKGLQEGESVSQLAERVESFLGKEGLANPQHRAEMIARTESARAYSAGEEEAWKQSGVVEGKQWLLAPDACEFCSAAAAQFEGQTVPLGKAFYLQGAEVESSEGMMVLDYDDVFAPPLHPQCRCALVPVLKEI